MNNGKKIDFILMNPPYSQRNNNDPIHFKFTEKAIDISETQVVIMPSRIIQTTSKNYDPWKKIFSKTLVSVEEYLGSTFPDTNMPNVGIFVFNSNKSSNNIKIKLLDNDNYNEVNSLLDSKKHDTYEENILKILNNDGNITLFNLKTMVPKSASKQTIIEDKTKLVNKIRNKYKNKYILSVNIANGGMNGTYISSKCGIIFNNFDDILTDWIDRNVGAIKYIVFDSYKEAQNCKDAMMRPLLRFALYRTQDDQNLNNKCYKYIPAINWEDPRVKTDEGLLEVCGCPKAKCKEYADYCRKIIEEVDNKR